MTRKNLIIISSLALIGALGGPGYYYRDALVHQFFPRSPQIEKQKDAVKKEEILVPKDAAKHAVVRDEKAELLKSLKAAGEKGDYSAFAILIKQVYDRHWIGEKDFYEVESKTYVKATDELLEKGKLEESLKVSTEIFNQVPTGWRFRYLLIRTLEKMGRNAFDKGDLKTAEEQALKMQTIMFRPEAIDLLADIYAKKINDAMAKNDLVGAKAAYSFISDYELPKEKKAVLDALNAKYHLK